jgi:adenylate kinase
LPHRLVLLGAPGVGKGTQAELLCANLGACHLSTGDIFRAAKALDPSERTPALTAALEHMRRGELVPDETVLALVTERVSCLRCEGGFLLDGFPRTVAQAEALETLLAREKLKLDAVLSYELPLEQIVSRLSGRRTCPGCKSVFHIEARPPKVAGICDHCGGKLYQREDDRPESIRVRMEAYERSTAPLADFYRRRHPLLSISAEGSPEDIFKRTMDALKCSLLVMTVIGPDRPGLVESVAALVAEHRGNWLESRMSRLGGQFAGILRVEVPVEREQALVAELRRLESRGLTVVVQPDRPEPSTGSGSESVLEIVGQDRPGIVREITHALASFGVNVEELETECASAAMSGETLFKARARLSIPASCNAAEILQKLERIAADLIVEISLAELPERPR